MSWHAPACPEFRDPNRGECTCGASLKTRPRSSWELRAVLAEGQRDELLAALKLYVEHFGDPLKVARAAITKAEVRSRWLE